MTTASATVRGWSEPNIYGHKFMRDRGLQLVATRFGAWIALPGLEIRIRNLGGGPAIMFAPDANDRPYKILWLTPEFQKRFSDVDVVDMIVAAILGQTTEDFEAVQKAVCDSVPVSVLAPSPLAFLIPEKSY